jgi:hypothetical protein
MLLLIALTFTLYRGWLEMWLIITLCTFFLWNACITTKTHTLLTFLLWIQKISLHTHAFLIIISLKMILYVASYTSFTWETLETSGNAWLALNFIEEIWWVTINANILRIAYCTIFHTCHTLWWIIFVKSLIAIITCWCWRAIMAMWYTIQTFCYIIEKCIITLIASSFILAFYTIWYTLRALWVIV